MDAVMPLAILAVIGAVMVLLFWRKSNRRPGDDSPAGYDDWDVDDVGGDDGD